MGKITLNLDTALTANQGYYILVDEGFTVNATTGDPSPAITDINAVAFTARAPMTKINSTPDDNYNDFKFGLTSPTKHIDLTFEQNVIAGTGSIVLYRLTSTFPDVWTAEQTINVTTGVVFGVESPDISIELNSFLVNGQTYKLILGDGTILDANCFSNREIDTTTSTDVTVNYNFQSATSEPTFTDSSIDIKFCEGIVLLTGDVKLYNAADELIETIDVTTGTAIIISTIYTVTGSYYKIISPGAGTVKGTGDQTYNINAINIGDVYFIKTVGSSDYTLLGATNNNIGTVFTANNRFTATAFVIGVEYEIIAPGTTDFTLIGAADNNIGTVFTATGPGTGTGTADATQALSGTGTVYGDEFTATGTGTGTTTVQLITHIIEGDSVRAPNVYDTLHLPIKYSLLEDTDYYITADRGVVGDDHGFSYKAIVKGDTDVTTTFNKPYADGVIIVQFDRDIVAGSGYIYLKKQITNELVNTYNIEATNSWINDNDANVAIADVISADDIVAFSGNRITIPVSLAQGSDYYLIIESAAITDTDGIPFAGLTNAADYDWFVYDGPVVDTATNTAIQTLALDYNEDLIAQLPSNFTIHLDSDDSLISTIANPADVTVINDTITMNPLTFDTGRAHYVLADKELYRNTKKYLTRPVTSKSAITFTTINSVSTLSPADNSTDVTTLASAGITITFDRPITVGTGNIVLHKTSDDSVVETFDVTTDATIGTNDINVVSTVTLTDTGYYILVDSGVATDSDGTGFAGITDKTFFNFVLNGLDIVTLVPADEATAITNLSTAGLVATFDDNFTANAGNIVLHRSSDDAVMQTFNVVTQATIVTDTITTDAVTVSLASETAYYVKIDAGALIDTNNTLDNGITDTTTWNFTTGVGPVYSSSTPVDNDSGVRTLDMTITMDQNITANTGNIYLYETTGNVLVDTWDITTVGIAGAVITLTNSEILDPLTAYYVKMDAGAVKDVNLITTVGITDTTTFNFTTGSTGVTTYSPLDNAASVRDVTTFAITFDRNITANTGNFYLRETIGDVAVKTWPIGGGDVSITTNTITLTNDTILDSTTGYYIDADEEVVYDSDNIYYGGIGASTTWNFTTGTPSIATLSPADGATDARQTDFVITFDQNVVAGIAGKKFTMRKTGGTFIDDWDITTEVTISGSQITLPGTAILEANTDYYIQAVDEVVNSQGLHWDGITDITTWNFTTGASSVTAYSPLDDATNVLQADLTITFDRNITANAGKNFYLKETIGDAIVNTWLIDGGDVSITTNTVTLLGKSGLNPSTGYYVTADDQVVYDSDNIYYGGISGTDTWNFTTGTGSAITATTPTDGATNIRTLDIDIVFDSNITVGTGNITLIETGASTVDTWDVTADVSVSTNTLTLPNAAVLKPNTGYHINLPATAIIDSNNIFFGGITGETTFNFTTGDVQIVTLDPVDNASGEDNLDISITFDKNITAIGTAASKYVRIWETSPLVEIGTYDVTSAVTIAGATLSIDNALTPVVDKDYHITIDTEALYDADNLLFDGFADTTTWNFTIGPPLVTSFVPADGSTGGIVTFNIVYDRDVTGITAKTYDLYETGVGIVKAFDGLNDTSISGGTVSLINKPLLSGSTAYHVLIDAGVVQDNEGLESLVLTDPAVWNFTTSAAPALTTLSPVDGATSISAPIAITFDTNMQYNTGSVLLKKFSDDSTIQTFNAISHFSISGGTVTLVNVVKLEPATQYYITIAADTLVSTDFVPYGGFTDNTTWNFTTDTVTVTTTVPVDGYTVGIGTPVNLTFDRNVFVHSGTIEIVNTSTSIAAQSFNIATQVTVDGNKITLDNVNALPDLTAYHITITADAISDGYTYYKGITNETDWNFETGLIYDVEATITTGLSNFYIQFYGDIQIDLTDSGTFTQYTDSGSGSFIGPVTTGGIVKIRGGNNGQVPLTRFRITSTNVVTAIDITEGSGITSLAQLCQSISSVTSFKMTNGFNVVNMARAFQGSGLNSFEMDNVSSVTTMNYTFSDTNLTSLPYIDTSSVTNWNDAFLNSASLVCLTNVDTTASGATKVSMFSGCTALVQPDATAQTDITDAGGANWTNAGSCPA